MHITLRQLEIFRAVALNRNVTAAAERLHISQPAASMALGELEKQLGFLFDRQQGHRMVLNERGRVLLPMANEVLTRSAEIEQHFTGKTDYLEGMLTVNASSTIGNNLMPSLIGHFNRDFPGIQISLSIDNTGIIADRLLSFEIDIGFVEGICLHPDIETIEWRKDELLIIAGANHPLAGRESLQLRDLENEPWILREEGSGTRSLFDELIASRLGSPRIGMSLNRSEAVKQAVRAGLGVACLSRLAADIDLRRGDLVVLPVSDLVLERYFYIAIHRKKFRGRMLQRFIDYIQACQS